MGVVVVVAVAVLLVALAVVVLYGRRPRHDAGVTSFRRHIDALSPEARRQVHDRVRDPESNRPDDDGAG
jgi:hypothetical protein